MMLSSNWLNNIGEKENWKWIDRGVYYISIFKYWVHSSSVLSLKSHILLRWCSAWKAWIENSR